MPPPLRSTGEEDEHETRKEVDGSAARVARHGVGIRRGSREPPRSAADRHGSGGRQHRRLRLRELRRGQPAARPDDPNRKVTFIVNVNPGQDPGDAPNYYNFDDEVLYAINIDNNKDGRADDVVYEFRFKTENRPIGGPGGLTSPVPYLGNPHIAAAGRLLHGITALDGPGSEGLTRRQTYTVTEVRGNSRTKLFAGTTLVAVPSNAGPATMPNYPALAAQGIYTDTATGVRVFAGQRAETFYIDLGAVFDTLNLRRYLPLLTGRARTSTPSTRSASTASAARTSARSRSKCRSRASRATARSRRRRRIRSSACMRSTARQKARKFDGKHGDTDANGPFIQVSRMGNPLVNELIINTPSKDKWNAIGAGRRSAIPGLLQESGARDGVQPGLRRAHRPARRVARLRPDGPHGHPAQVPGPGARRLELRQSRARTCCDSTCATPPTAPESQKRLGAALSADPAGWPNGRRPNDDVTDIAIRVVGGNNYIAAKAGDGVNFLAGAPGTVGTDITANGIARNFPFLPTPYDSRNRRHVDCDESGPGANPCGPLVP